MNTSITRSTVVSAIRGKFLRRTLATCLVALAAIIGAKADEAPDTYMIIDLSGGPDAENYPVSFRSDAPAKGWGDDCRSYLLVLRKIPAGSFMMGSPTNEPDRVDNEDFHKVTITKPFYIGLFEVTRRQWELVMGSDPGPSPWSGNSLNPVSNVSFQDIRGKDDGAKWPESDAVDADSFLGRIRNKTGRTLDLPTEAQWEYACRAGTQPEEKDQTRCFARRNDSLERVGSLDSNAWGLYDMQGSLMEWCLDLYQKHLGHNDQKDPKGAPPLARKPEPLLFYDRGMTRVLRGGNSRDYVMGARPASRHHEAQVARDCIGFPLYGFRVACP